jgi:hypothetical protein
VTLPDRKRQGGWWRLRRVDTAWLDACVIYVLAGVLSFPLFRVNYLDNWPSIESTFIADARLLQENWTHHLWQPLWYLGTRIDYVYPPGLRYGVGILSSALDRSPARAYHIFIALFYAFGIAGVYLWTRAATGSRGEAWVATAGVALVSPAFLILTADLRHNDPFHIPWRLYVLIRFGEGPHISALAVLPMAWLGAWRRFHGGSIRWLLLSAGAAAVVVTLNFYGATALAITFPLLAWACFLERQDRGILRDSLVIAALAYGLTAWWLTPSYVQVTLRDLHLVAAQGNAWSVWVLAAILIVYGSASIVIRRRVVFPAYSFFACSALGFLSLYILGQRWFGFQVAGDLVRLIPEWDLLAVLCGVRLATQVWKWRPAGSFWRIPPIAARIALAAILVVCLRPSWRYLKHAYTEFRPDDQWQRRVEYRTPEWLWQRFPDQRVFVSGSIRFWYNVWRDGQQADGGSSQGILDPMVPTPLFRVPHDKNPELLLHWLQAMGVDIVVVPGASSQELYHDFSNGAMYDAHFPLLRDDGEGNRYYRVPRRVPGIVRVVDRMKLAAAPPIPPDYETEQIRAYAEATEAVPPGGGAPDRARGHWRGSDELDVETETQPGEALLVEETYDPYWRAYADGKAQVIQRDAVGLMVVDLPPGKHSLRLVFETPLEISVGRALTFTTLALMVFLAYAESRRGALE